MRCAHMLHSWPRRGRETFTGSPSPIGAKSPRFPAKKRSLVGHVHISLVVGRAREPEEAFALVNELAGGNESATM